MKIHFEVQLRQYVTGLFAGISGLITRGPEQVAPRRSMVGHRDSPPFFSLGNSLPPLGIFPSSRYLDTDPWVVRESAAQAI